MNLRWYGTPHNIYSDERILKSDYNYSFKIFQNLLHLPQKYIYKIQYKKFEPATNGLLACPLTNWATRYFMDLCTKLKSFSLFVLKGSTSHNGGVPFPLKDHSRQKEFVMYLSNWFSISLVRVNQEEKLYKNKSLVISWSTEDWYRVEMEGLFSSSLTACVNFR